MKLSVSLDEEDVAYLDSYANARGLPSRSAVIQHTIRLLRLGAMLAADDAEFGPVPASVRADVASEWPA